jgi:hypothetical protein
MAAPAARVDYGTFTDSPCTNEANLLIQSVSCSAAKDQQFWKDITTGCDTIGRTQNRSCTWDIKGYVKAVNGFVTQAIGTTVSTLANFASAFRSFDPATGLNIFDDPTDSWAMQDLRDCSFKVMHKPYIA